MSSAAVRCPRCGTMLAVAATSASYQLQCPACAQVLTIAAAPSPPTPPTAGPLPPHLLPGARQRPAPPAVSAPVATQPVNDAETIPPAKPRGMWLELSFLALVGMLVVGGALIGVIAWRNSGSQTNEEALTSAVGETTLMDVSAESSSSGPVKWSNAERVSLSMNKVVVRIRNADYGPVRGRDGEKYVVVSSDKTLLTLRLKIMSFRERPYDYRSWYNNDPRATLYDDRGQAFKPHVIRTQELQGYTPTGKLAQNQPIEDVIVFKLPPESSPDKCAYYRLELSAAAYNKPGIYRFEIPRSMIQSPLSVNE